MPAKVLAVCTANQCRSPMMELLLRQAADREPALGWTVRSAGTRAVSGEPLLPDAEDALLRRGVRAAGFVSRRLARDLVAGADLILTAEAHHRSAVVSMYPRALHRTFTFRQFVRLVSTDIPARDADGVGLAGLVAHARRARSAARPGDDELLDPTGGAPADFDATAELVATGVETIMAIYRARFDPLRHTVRSTPSR